MEMSKTTRRDFDIGIGVISLDEPSDWPEGNILPGPNGSPVIQIGRDSEPRVQVLIAPFASTDPKEVSDSVKRMAAEMGKEAVNPSPPLTSMSGSHGSGWIFSAVDKKYSDPGFAPTALDFKNVTQGSLVIGKLAIAFTILSNDDGSAAVTDALAMIKQASFAPGAGAH
jgi:hypothetical protein